MNVHTYDRTIAEEFGGAAMGREMPNFDQLPQGKFSALNVNIADMPYVVCSGAGGSVFFQDEMLAKTYAAREVNSGRELSMTVCKLVPIARVQPKSLSVDITALDAEGKPALESGSSDRTS